MPPIDLTNKTPMIAPDGTGGLADSDKIQALSDKGYALGHVLHAPDGTRGVVKATDVPHFLSKGYQQEGDWARANGGTPSTAPAPQAKPLYEDHPGVMGWLTQNPKIGHLRENVQHGIEHSERPNTIEDINKVNGSFGDQLSLYGSQLDRGLEGFGSHAAKMLINPLGAITSVLGLGAEAGTAEAASTAARATGIGIRSTLSGIGVGFGAQSAADIWKKGITPNAAEGETGYTDPKYAERVLGDAAGFVGGLAGVVEAPHIRYGKNGKPVPSTTPQATSPATPVDAATQGATRKAQAIGSAKPAATPDTVHVTPQMADLLDQWNKSPLPGKRLVVKQYKNGAKSIDLMHTDPDTSTFKPSVQMKDPDTGLPKFDNSVSDTPQEGRIPVELSKTDGKRGTTRPGNYLANKILRPAEQPENAPGAIENTPATQPQPETTPTAPTPQAAPANANVASPTAAPTTAPGTLGSAKAKALRLGNTLAAQHPEWGASEIQHNIASFMTDDEKALLNARNDHGMVDSNVSSQADAATTPEGIHTAIEKGVQDQRGSGPGLPQDLSKSTPNYGYKGNNFKLNFEDPRDLAAYTIAQKTQNKAHGRFMDYLKGEFPDLSEDDLRAKGAAVRDQVKEIAKTGDPKDGPLQVPASKDTPSAPVKGMEEAPDLQKEAPTTQQTPTVAKSADFKSTGNYDVQIGDKKVQISRDPSNATWYEEGAAHFSQRVLGYTKDEAIKALTDKYGAKETSDEPQAKTPLSNNPREERIRKLTGQTMRLGQLRSGELASHAIDIGIRESQDVNGSIPDDTADKLGKLLKEDVGNQLTPEQINKLETMRGAQMGTEPKVKVYDPATVRARLNDPVRGEDFQKKLDRADEAVLTKLQDPNLTDGQKSRLQSLLEPDAKGNRKYFSYDPETEYPQPKETPADHPEAPFAKYQFGHEITPFTLKNLTAVLERKPYSKFQDSAKGKFHATTEDVQTLNDLKGAVGDDTSDGLSDAQDAMRQLLGGRDAEESGFNIQDKKGGVRKGSEASEFERTLGQKSIDSRQASTLGVLKGEIGKLMQEGGPSPELRSQLDALSPNVKRLLPKELFDGQEQIGASTPAASEGTPNAKPAETSAEKPTPAEAATSGTGSTKRTPTKDLEAKILEEFPDKQRSLDGLLKATSDRHPGPKTPQMYNKALQVYHDQLMEDDPYALAKALDVINVKPKDLGATMGMGLGGAQDLFGTNRISPLTPDERHSISSQAADNFLKRWENMTTSELAKKKPGLWKDSLVDPIEQSKPVSNDPAIRQDQMDTYADLKQRHDDLKIAAGGPTGLLNRMSDSMNDFLLNRLSRQEAGRILREVAGNRGRNDAILTEHWGNVDKFMTNLPFADKARFWDNMTRGFQQDPKLFDAVDPQKLADYSKKNPAMLDPNEIANQLRQTMDEARDRVTATSGKLDNFFVNYMPGFWDNQAKARNFTEGWTGNRNFQGDTSFLKQKMYEYYEDGLKAGLQPATDNPVRAAMMITEQMNRYSMAHDFKNQLLDQVLASHFEQDQTPPQGWEKLDDRLFNSGSGGYYAPQAVSRVFNNFVSTGLRGKWKVPYTNLSLYDGIRNSTNLQNGMQLGLSLFHATETMLNSGFSTMAIGLKQAVNEGKPVKGALNFFKGSSFVVPIGEDFWNGRKGLINFRDPDQQLQYQQLNSDLEKVNANVPKQNWEFPAIDNLRKNFETARDSFQPNGTRAVALAKSALNVLGVAAETTMAPLMQGLIPRVKLGAFYKMAQQIHSEYEGAPPETINLELQKAWDSVDNRFGQVNKDNLFMSKTAQDVTSLLVRSPGWNIGTLREVGGGVSDLIGSVNQARQGNGFNISNRTAYTGAMVMGTMMINAAYQYLKSGESPSGIDYFFPKDGTKTTTGEANRMYPKTYVYDFINMVHDPLHTVEHKAAPGISTMSDILNNSDYYHREIRDPGDSKLGQVGSTLGYIAQQFVPFSFKNMQESKLRNQPQSWESYAGVLPAPRYVGRSNAENLAFDYFKGTQPSGGQDPVQLEKKQNFINLRNELSQGKIKDDDIQKALDSGKIEPNTVKYLYQSMKDPQIVNWTKRLDSPNQVWNIWTQANDQEKKLLFHTVYSKIIRKTTGTEQEQKMEELQHFADRIDDIPADTEEAPN